MVFLLSFNHYNKIKNLKISVLLLYSFSRDLIIDFTIKITKVDVTLKTKYHEKTTNSLDANGCDRTICIQSAHFPNADIPGEWSTCRYRHPIPTNPAPKRWNGGAYL